MDPNKIIEKANLVIQKQYEMKDIIYELKNELLKLQKENGMLRKRLSRITHGAPEVVVEETKVEPVKVVEKAVPVEPSKAPRPGDASIFKDKHVTVSKAPVAKVAPKVPVDKEPVVRSERVSVISEFFLGKNIIAKIASVLIFLGFVSFGQLTYIWLSDIGRVILIVSVGILFFVAGYFFEKRKNTVFNNVFYATGLLVMFLSFNLAYNAFELINYTAVLYISFAFVGLSFGYFYKKRYDFLDTFLFIFYLVIFGYLLYFGRMGGMSGFFNITGLILSTIGLGFIMYTYLIVYEEINQKLQVIGIGYLALQFYILIVSIYYGLLSTSDSLIVWIIVVFTIFMMNLINIKFLEKEDFYKVIAALSTLLITYTAAAAIAVLLRHYGLVDDHIHILLFMIVLLIPMYTYLFLKDETAPEEFSSLDFYAILISLFVLIYTFTFTSFNSLYETPFFVHNMVLGGMTIVSYGLYRYTKKVTYKGILYVYFGILSLTALIRYFTVTSLSDYSRFLEFNTRYIVTNDNTEYLIYLSSLIVGIALIAINKWYGKMKEEEVFEESLVLYGFSLYMILPITFLIVDIFHEDILARYGMIMMSIVTIIIVLYRYLLNLKIFEVKYLEEFKVGIQIKAALFILILNFVYLDHNFAVAIDLITFFIVLGLNLYVVVLFKEVYDYFKKIYGLEQTFITIYLIGVFIQSMFIHRYINFAYDKVFLSSYFIIASALAILYGFRNKLLLVRKLGLGAIYFSLIKFFTYDFFGAEFTLTVRMVTYFILGLLLMAIAFMYGYLEKRYGETA